LPWQEESIYIIRLKARQLCFSVIDVSTNYAFQDITGFSNFLDSIRQQWPVLLLDGMGDNALARKMSINVDLLVVPYVGAEASDYREGVEGLLFLGPQFFISDLEYRSVANSHREIRDNVDRLLVSFGGSDRNLLTVKVLDALSFIDDRRFTIRIIVGPGFSSSLKTKLEQMSHNIGHSCELIQGSRSLKEHMIWCDMAITSSGLTKYELALTGTPSIQISINEEHSQVNRPFADTGASRHLGVGDNLSVYSIRDAIVALVEDKKTRQKMSEIGQNILDSQGASRIMDEINKVLKNHHPY
jgi:spore coat polysaccharide biosynthesis predicted glycosyltransferase SpsG